MKNDTYLKVVLTVIALALVGLFFKPTVIVNQVASPSPSNMPVNHFTSASSGDMSVNIRDSYGYRIDSYNEALKVYVVNK